MCDEEEEEEDEQEEEEEAEDVWRERWWVLALRFKALCCFKVLFGSQ